MDAVNAGFGLFCGCFIVVLRLFFELQPIQAVQLPSRRWHSAGRNHEGKGMATMKTWVPVRSTWKRWLEEPRTLADCPEEVPVICERGSWYMVVERKGNLARFWKTEDFSNFPAIEWKFLRYLDTPPEAPTLTLEALPDGRVIESHGHLWWRSGGKWYRQRDTGEIAVASYRPRTVGFRVTDIVMTLEESEV